MSTLIETEDSDIIRLFVFTVVSYFVLVFSPEPICQTDGFESLQEMCIMARNEVGYTACVD